ncbi:cellulase family glycosylhydrolase [Pseudomonas sp. JH-2]|nr:cellulase family glycosylhydrolase [Pseudomonas sp. JH-2]
MKIKFLTFATGIVMAIASHYALSSEFWKSPHKGFNIHPDITTAEILEIKSLGASIVRLSFDTVSLINKHPPYNINQEAISRLNEIIKLCEDQDLFVILDLHTAPGLESNFTTTPNDSLWRSQEKQHILIEAWRDIAKQYKYRSRALIAYDILNEPSMAEGYHVGGHGDWNILANKIVSTIRQYDKKTTILIEPAAKLTSNGKLNTRAEAMDDLTPIEDRNIVYSPHVYTPLQYTHQGIGLKNFKNRTYPGFFENEYWDKEKLREALKPIRDFQTKYDVNIFIGEFSAINGAPGREAYLRDLISLFDEYQWGWTYHDYSNSKYWSPKSEFSNDDHTLLLLKRSFN